MTGAMPTFTYQARDDAGRPIRGILEAESQVALADRLRKMGYLVTRMEEMRPGLRAMEILSPGRGVPREALLFGAVQLANLSEAGVSLTSSLRTVAEQQSHRGLREALEDVRRQIEAGSSFSQALTRHPRVFPALMVSLSAVGEATGKLDVVLSRFAHFTEKDLTLRRNIQEATTYPALVVAASLCLILFVVSFVVPQFALLFAKAGLALPGPTQVLAAVGATLRERWWALLLGGIFLGAGSRLTLQVPQVRLRVDGWLLRLPLVGPILHQAIVARFSRTLSTLVASGIPILRALQAAEGVLGNRVLAEEVRRVYQAVEHGERIAPTLSVGGIFYPDAIQMIRVGEESGRLDIMLERIADFYELRVGHSLRQLTTFLEPALLVLAGGIVAFIMASLLLPMFDMVKLLQRGGIR